jgi:prophage regulatory protein
MILNFNQVQKLVGYGRTSLWRMEREGRFPKRVKLGPNKVGWHEYEILEWIKNLPR